MFSPDAVDGYAAEEAIHARLQSWLDDAEVRRTPEGTHWDFEVFMKGQLFGRLELKSRSRFGRVRAVWNEVVRAFPGLVLSRTRKAAYLIDSSKQVPTFLLLHTRGDDQLHIYWVKPEELAALPVRDGGRSDRVGFRNDRERVIDVPWGSFHPLTA